MSEKFHSRMTLSEAANDGPPARRIIDKYFGRKCYECPSFKGEPLFMSARMHAVDLEQVLRELNGLS